MSERRLGWTLWCALARSGSTDRASGAIDRPFNFLQILTWIDFSRVSKISEAPAELEHLVAAVRGVQSTGSVREAICPYRGLDAFREEDSLFFFWFTSISGYVAASQ